jgi:maltooligosyltrehalose synthase
VVPRLLAQRLAPDGLPLGAAVWGDTLLELPPAVSWYNLFTGEMLAGEAEVAVAEVLRAFPVALLIDAQSQPFSS